MDKTIDEMIELSEQEETALAEGQALYEMTKGAGWAVVERWLKDAAFHSWIDPREVTNKKEWEWRELNGFHASNVSREILENVSKAINEADYYDKVKKGEVKRRRMTI